MFTAPWPRLVSSREERCWAKRCAAAHLEKTSDMSMVSMSAAVMIWMVTRMLTPAQSGDGASGPE